MGNLQSMTSNGKRRPPRPALEVVAPGAGPEEAAAIAAALERFLADTAPALVTDTPATDPWTRSAILEAVGLTAPTPWGDSEPWRGAR